MRLKDQEAWERGLKKNQDAYGACTYRYAQRWAELMEERMAAAKMPVADVASFTSHDADTEGITGFMYGCAVSVLASVWEHGEDLRRWHNLDCQCHDEGEKANEKGTVLNPAVMTIGLPPEAPDAQKT